MDSNLDFLADQAQYVGVKNVADKYVGTPLFKAALLILLPETYKKEEKEAFYNDLIKNNYIIQTDKITLDSNASDTFNYETPNFETFLNQTFGNDKQTIDKIKKFYDDNKPFFKNKTPSDQNKKRFLGNPFRKKTIPDQKKRFFRNPFGKNPTSVKQSGGKYKKSNRTNKRKKSSTNKRKKSIPK
jgi:hypothetical protein